MRWEELRGGEKSSHDLRWDEVWSVKCKCEVWRMQCEVWGKCLIDVALHRGRSMTCARPRRNATPSVHFLHTSQCTLHTPHFTLHTSHLHFTLHTSSHLKACELFLPHLRSSDLIPSLLTCHQSKFNCFHLIRALINLSHLLEVVLNSSQPFCAPESSYCQRDVSRTKKTLGAESFFAHRHLRHKCI